METTTPEEDAMGYMDSIRNLFRGMKNMFYEKNRGLQPREILVMMLCELEKRKKYGIEEKAFVPNVYAVYLNSFDYEEMSPLLSGIKEQLKNRIMEKARRKGYKLLSSSISIDIREDSGLLRNQVVVESSFLKEKTPVTMVKDNVSASSEKGQKEKGIERHTISPRVREIMNRKDSPAFPPHGVETEQDVREGGTCTEESAPEPLKEKGFTKIIEDKKTRFIDNARARLEIVGGEESGDVIALQEGEYTFGRGRNAQLLIKDKEEMVSRVHFKLIVKDGHIRIKDLGSLNGTKVNEIEIEEAELKKGDIIAAGKALLKVA
ncbi:MAG: hypothetical protein C0392_04085 [Syntrophus sp. (in: bacteria)]|nr:hypothetical protein [Syntrophus sp. (in: bacteria)]